MDGTGWLFWLSMAGAQAGAFILFKDLADISQWVVQSSRRFTMGVWYNRHALAGVSVALLLLSGWAWWLDRGVCPPFVLALLVALFLLNFYSGMLNTAWMFRPQQHAARFVSVDEAPALMQRSLRYARFGDARYETVDEVSVLVLETDEGARAYSDYYLLQPHVAAGAKIGGEEAVMTYCGLTNLGVAYNPSIEGQPLELRAITQLKNNLVLADAVSGEPIQQLWGYLEGAPARGRMREFATIRMPFGSFRRLYPDGKVYINEIKDFSENPVLALWDRLVRHGMMLWGVGLQWRHPDKPAFPTIERDDRRLPMKQLVYALNVGDDYVAYTKEFLRSRPGPVNVRVGGQPLVVAYDAGYDVVTAFFNPGGTPVERIDVFGRVPSGERLQRANTLKNGMFWFIQAEFYPQTDVNRC